MQHLVSKSREEDVADEEVPTEDSLHRSRQEHDVGPLAATVPVPITGIAIRICPKLPPTSQERIADNRAQSVADSVMYREHVFQDFATVLGCKDINAFLLSMDRSIGPPWQAKHKLAAAVAIAATK